MDGQPRKDGCLAILRDATAPSFITVSVPFSMGTVLRRPNSRPRPPGSRRFSPLLDGDGVASRSSAGAARSPPVFQSPSRWGRCCVYAAMRRRSANGFVSVPFSMGTVLRRKWRHHLDIRTNTFQSPSRWGRCCVNGISQSLVCAVSRFQSPSRWGRCCVSQNPPVSL